jgi:hypothetical protein
MITKNKKIDQILAQVVGGSSARGNTRADRILQSARDLFRHAGRDNDKAIDAASNILSQARAYFGYHPANPPANPYVCDEDGWYCVCIRLKSWWLCIEWPADKPARACTSLYQGDNLMYDHDMNNHQNLPRDVTTFLIQHIDVWMWYHS